MTQPCLAATLLIGVISGLAQVDAPRQVSPRAFDQAVAILERSRDGGELERAAIGLCKSNHAKAIEVLTDWLLKPHVWQRLDREEHYKYYHGCALRVNRILWAIGDVGTPQAEAAILKLAGDKAFTAERDRVGGLIESAGGIREPSQKLLAFLDSHATPRGGLTGTVIHALARMRSANACKLIEKRFLSADYDVASKAGWCELDLMLCRDDAAIVALYRRMIALNVKEGELRNALVQSLFSYNPLWFGVWESIEPPPKPPKWSDTKTEVLRELVEIAELTKDQDLTPVTREGVQEAVKEINAILAEREKKK